jgi:processive 1,2-diacylglycerol beta-glucosyltransferase
MKILVVYASAGSGHRRAAEAIYNCLSSRGKVVSVAIVDILDYCNPLFNFFYSLGYTFLISNLPTLWGFLYLATKSSSINWFVKRIRFFTNRLNTRKFIFYLRQEQPEIVISTHFLANEVISYFKRRFKIRPKLVSIITDFGVHPFWLNDGVNEYDVALVETKEELIKMGVTPDNIKVRGIPVNLKFSAVLDRKLACQRLGIEKDLFTVLIVTGTIGVGPIRQIFKVLKDKIQLLIVCGRNKKLFSKLKAEGSRYSRIYGLVDNMDELMAASHMIITKPGGLSIAEALARTLPIIFIYIVPGQERINAEIFERYKIGIIAKNINGIRDTVLSYRDNVEMLEYARDNIRNIAKANSTEEICNALCKDSSK